jgi:tRNA pseudouridine55 synthase
VVAAVLNAPLSGILLVDKPAAWTSHDVVARIRRLAGTRKVGHAGTLDPMATGVLVLGYGSSTRLLTYMVGLDKEYSAVIRLGQSTTTDDAEGDVVATAKTSLLSTITDHNIPQGVTALTGHIGQVPSTVSAIKVDGKRAYARARAGEKVVLARRAVFVSEFTIVGIVRAHDCVDVSVRVVCSSGTYVRALARDLGGALGVGGHVTVLRRTRVGPFPLAEAHLLDGLDVKAATIAPADAATRLFRRFDLTAQQATDLANGKKITSVPVPLSLVEGPIAAVAPTGALIGLVRISGGTAVSVVNFPVQESVTL